MTETYPPDLSYGPKSRVVLIGTSECPKDGDNLPPLPQVRANVRELQRLFLDTDVIGLRGENIVVTILDGLEASEILTRLEEVANEATDTLIVYYAGHGLYGDQYAALYLTSKNTRSDKKASCISIDEVKKVIRYSPATKRMLILDCCYSGRAFTGGMNDSRDDFTNAVDLIGTYGIAAVPGDQKAWAPPGAKYTKFTEALIAVLTTGVPTGRPTLTLDEVFIAVKEQIRRGSETRPPECSNWRDGSKFKLARNRCLVIPEDAPVASTSNAHLPASERFIRFRSTDEYARLIDLPLSTSPIPSGFFSNIFLACCALAAGGFFANQAFFESKFSFGEISASVIFGGAGLFMLRNAAQLVREHSGHDITRVPVIVLAKREIIDSGDRQFQLDLQREDGTKLSAYTTADLYAGVREGLIGLAELTKSGSMITFRHYRE